MKRTINRTAPLPTGNLSMPTPGLVPATGKQSTSKFKLILSADWHLRDDTPQCRERDEYMAAQERKLKFIHDLCEENEATLLIAGDIFNCTGNDQKGYWKPTPQIISLAIHYIPPGTIVVPGQHDMVARNMQEMGKTGLQTLAEAGRVYVLSGGLRRVLGGPGGVFGAVYGYAYGEEAQNPPKEDKKVVFTQILMWHRLVCQRKQPWPGAEANLVTDNISHLPGFDLQITGDNHQQFYGSAGGGRAGFCNPGSLMRMSSDQADFEPAVFGWSEDGTVTRIPLPIEKGVVKATTSNAKAKESRDARMSAYISRATKQYETKLSFTKNLEQHFKTNKENKGVETIVWKAVETNEK